MYPSLNSAVQTCSARTVHYLVFLWLLIFAASAVPAWSQSFAVPEFVSLDHPANFENGSLQINGQVLEIDMISEAWEDTYTANLVNGDGAVLNFTSYEEPQMKVQFTYQGNNYRGDGFFKTERPSQVIANATVAEFSGVLFDDQNREYPAVLTVTESLAGGGDSKLTISGDYAYLSGDLGTRTYNQIFNLIHQHPNVRTIVEQNVGGSVNDDINMQTGRLIRRAGLATHIPSDGEASSGGVDLFCAGAYRSLGQGAKVGVHSWSEDDQEARFFPPESPQHSKQIAYFNEMLGHPTGRDFYFFTINAAPADGMHLMTPQEVARYGLVTQ